MCINVGSEVLWDVGSLGVGLGCYDDDAHTDSSVVRGKGELRHMLLNSTPSEL